MFLFFFFNDTATTEIYTLSLHDALPICDYILVFNSSNRIDPEAPFPRTFYPGASDLKQAGRIHLEEGQHITDRKSTRLNSSHGYISYAVFCLKKKKVY